ncbi:MAG: hypothetical protein LBU00_00025 [Treponema sp.]|jgi:hypothetical protein|nr:hypothetical protein [Treponema sp.]
MKGAVSDGIDQHARVEAALDTLAAKLISCLDIEAILSMAQRGVGRL